MQFRWCLRVVETVSGEDDRSCSGKPRDRRELLELSIIVRIGLETYRSYESTTKRKSILCVGGRWEWGLFPNAVDRLESCLTAAMQTVPALCEVGFSSVLCGPTIWTPDALPRCGRTSVPVHRPTCHGGDLDDSDLGLEKVVVRLVSGGEPHMTCARVHV